MSFECTECNRVFSFKGNLTRHLRMVHNIEVERVDILPGDFDTYHYKCLEGCNISFKYNRELRTHLRVIHELNLVELNLEFPNSEEFNKWLRNEESNNYVQYVHLTATKRKTTGTETFYYECSKTGKRNYVDDNVRKRRPRKLLTKINRGCTSQLIVNKSHDGTYNVIYFKTHYGHEIGIEHMKLSKQDRGAIASKLVLGLPISKVLHSAKNTTGSIKRINLLARKDISNIRKSFNIDLKDGKLPNADTISVNFFLEECYSHENNPILYCNINEFPESEDILFIIMTKNQAEILTETENNTVVINSVSLKNCDFDLISLFVIGKCWESFPAACMFTNKIDSTIYELFFNKIKEKVGCITPTVLYTNCEEMYYNSWKKIMGEVQYNFYSSLQIEVDWKLNLNRIVCKETDVTKVKRKWVYDSLKSLQNNKEENDLIENFEATVKVLRDDEDFNDFLDYFLKNFNDLKKWAGCYRINLDLPTKQLEIFCDVLKQYLNEEIEIRFDKIFHSLIRFIRDETVNALLKSKTNRLFFINENDTRHQLLTERNLNATNLGENLYNVIEDDKTYVVQKFLEKKCCNLICTTCNICLHCFSCSCVDFFVANVICVHIHYIWLTYFQSIMENTEDSNDKLLSCDEEIVVEIDESQEDEIQILRDSVVDKISVLCKNISKSENKRTLTMILDTLNQLCDLSEEQNCVENDHSYL